MKTRRSSTAARLNAHLDLTPPLRVRGGVPAGWEILRELGTGTGVGLFRFLRLVLLWAARSIPDSRPPDLGASEELRAQVLALPLPPEVLVAVRSALDQLREWHGAVPPVVADGCSAVGEWAGRTGAPAAAAEFIVAAAQAEQGDPGRAWVAGRLLRDQARWRESEAWLRRAHAAARRIGDRELQVRTVNSLGVLLGNRGAYRGAEDRLERALRLSRRFRLAELQAEVIHDLAIVVMDAGDSERAELLAIQAFDAYGEEHPNIPRLAHDAAQVWLGAGQYSLALAVLQRLPPLPLPHERVRCLASLAKAAGSARDALTFDHAWTETLAILHDDTVPLTRYVLPNVLLDLAEGAAHLERWSDARELLRSARDAAAEREEAGIVRRADRLIGSLGEFGVGTILRRFTPRRAVDLSRSLLSALDAHR